MLIAVLDPEIYLKSSRTQSRMVRVLIENLVAAFDGNVTVRRMAGHRVEIDSSLPDAAERAARVFGVAVVEHVEPIEVTTLDALAYEVARRSAERVSGRTFAVRPRRMGSHPWSSQALAVAAGSLLVEAGGKVDLTRPEVTVSVRVVDAVAYLTTGTTPGIGGLPLRTQGRALMLFSGGIDSPVAAHMIQQRGVEVDYLHFSLGCGQADHAAGIAHDLWRRFGAGSDPILVVVDFEHAAAEIPRRVAPRDRQMALKAAMYETAERIAQGTRGTKALITGESLGQVSTQTLDNLAALDRLVAVPVLRPLVGLGKQEIRRRAEEIGTYDMSARTREMCDISAGARVAVSTRAHHLEAMGDGLGDLVEEALATAKHTRLADWMPGADATRAGESGSADG
jgi:tRNA uracil 4-sulfurtransferase